MRQVILDFPKQFQIGLRAAEKIEISRRFNGLLICGLGGSALPANILEMFLENYKIDLPLYIHRDYNLPYRAKKDFLVICISYSGNTEETISAFKTARKQGFKIISITSGGKLANLSQKYNIPLAKIPSGLQPRMALGLQFSALMKILVKNNIIKYDLKNLISLEKRLKPETLEVQGKKIAKRLVNKIPLIYSSRKLLPLSRIWKIKLNENSKIPAFYNYFPELNHNEMVGFTKNKNNFHIIILTDPNDNPRIKKRERLLLNIFKKDKKISGEFLNISGKDLSDKIFNNILLADWVSYYLALEYKIDPLPVKIVEEFKEKMKFAEASPHLHERSEGREMNKVQRTTLRPAKQGFSI